MTAVEDAARVQIAVAQMPVRLGDVDLNTATVLGFIRQAGASGDRLVVFPECAMTGYLLDSRQAVAGIAIRDTDPRITAIQRACLESDVHVVVGLLEEDSGDVFNTALVIGPNGVLGRYRKHHLPYLGADRFVKAGFDSSPRVIDTPIGRVGVMICFDLRFPESARELALQGADIIAMPTNWPPEATFLAEHMTRVRAVENLVYLAVSDRADTEHGIRFLGRSQIVGPNGNVLVDAGISEGLFSATVDLGAARTKKLVIDPGVFELPVFEGRRPEMYGELTRTVPAPDVLNSSGRAVTN